MASNRNDAGVFTWDKDIRNRIVEMAALVTVFAISVIGYYSWNRSQHNNMLVVANEYHLASTFYYLKSVSDLQDIHRALENYSLLDNMEARQAHIKKLMYQARQDINEGLHLETRFTDDTFSSLAFRLRNQSLAITDQTLPAPSSATDIAEFESHISGTLITLRQLINLHRIEHDRGTAAAKQLEEKISSTMSLLLLSLVIGSALIVRRGLESIRQITKKQIEMESRISHQANYDSLTGLPNRFLCLQLLNQMMHEADRSSTKVAVLFVDLDDFKKINDSLGHEIGDKLLEETGQRLSASIRKCDIVGRLGGDEFIVLLGGLGDEYSTGVIAENLLNKMRKPFLIDSRKMMLTTSVGIAIYPRDCNNAADLLRHADSAMYHSKKQGRDTFAFFDTRMAADSLRRLEVEEQMQGAIERGEFSVVYQPKIDLNNHRIMGNEALVRWHNQSLGDISPVEFIPIAEQNGLIVNIGQFVLDQALAATANWQKLRSDEPLCTAINLSPRQFRDPQLIDFLKSKIQQFGLASEVLELEITEGILMSQDKHIDQVLKGLSELGIRLAMDDFGTGYSSLSYLRNYPFDVLKIDRTFIKDIDGSERGRQLIQATISMARALNIKVVAEGVETSEQLEFLKQQKCDYAQGYLFSPPVSEREFTQLHVRQHSLHDNVLPFINDSEQ